MPIITIQMARGRDVDVKRRLAGEIARLLADTLDVDPEWVTVLFQEYERENWSTGGRTDCRYFSISWVAEGVP
jgi:4-oxalocrotonate tautomerase